MNKKILSIMMVLMITICLFQPTTIFAQSDFWVVLPSIEADDIVFYSEDSYIIEKDEKFGIISSMGEMQLPIEFEYIGSCFCMDNSHQVVVSKNSANNSSIYEKKNGIYTYIGEHEGHGGGSINYWDLNSNRVFYNEYFDEFDLLDSSYCPELAFMQNIRINEQKGVDGNYSFFTGDWESLSANYAFVKYGELLTDFIFEDYKLSSDDLIPVKKDNKWGYMDQNADIEIIPQFDFAGLFNCAGIAPAGVGEEYFFVDSKGNRVESTTFERTCEFDYVNGNAFVKQNGKWGIVSNTISYVAPMQCEQAYIDFINNDLKNIQYDEFDEPDIFYEAKVRLNYDNFKYAYIMSLNNDINPSLVCLYEYISDAGDDIFTYVIFRYQNGRVILADTLFDGRQIVIANNQDVYITSHQWRDIGGGLEIYYTYNDYKLEEKYYVSVIYFDSVQEEEQDLQFDFSQMDDTHSNAIPGVRVNGVAVSKEQCKEIYRSLCENTDLVRPRLSNLYYNRPRYLLQQLTDRAYRLVTDKTVKNSYISPYIYDYFDIGTDIILPFDKLAEIKDQASANKVVEEAAKSLTDDQKQSATSIDKMTVFAEAAVANASTKTVSDSNIVINNDTLSGLGSQATNTAKSLDNTLASNGVVTQREINTTVKILTSQNKVSIDKTAVSGVDTVKVQTSGVSVSLPASETVKVDIESQGSNKVAVTFDTNSTSTVKVSFPTSGDTKYAAVVDENGRPVGGKYNPATETIEAKVSESGVYSVTNNPKDFADIKDKAQEMQDAIKILASKGVINGTSETTFSPDSTISRAEIAALIVRTLSKLDPNEDGEFADVNQSNWYFGAAGSSKKYGIINGFEDNTFRGGVVIPKDQIVAVTARVLKNEMRYKTPGNVSEYLPYADAGDIAEWAQGDVALATMANLIVKRTDDKFVGNDEMTRGDAAIILYRLFEKIW